MKNKFTLVEDALGVYNDRVWYYIPYYNGYEISNDGYIRSMKHYRKYPFGLLIEPKKNRKGEILQPIRYELSNDNNEREVLTLDEIKNLAYNNPRKIQYYGLSKKNIFYRYIFKKSKIFC